LLPQTAAAQAPQQAAAGWEGVWRATEENDLWFDIDTVGGKLEVNAWRKVRVGDLAKAGSLELDTARSTPGKMFGQLKLDDLKVLPAELTLAPDGAAVLMQLTHPGEKSVQWPIYLRRVDQVGSAAGQLTRRQVEDRLVGRWTTPLGDLLIESQNGGDANTRLISAKLFRADGRTIRSFLDLHHFAGGSGSETSVWQWHTPTDRNAKEGLRIAISPDGRTLTAADTGPEPLGGLRNWTATRSTTSPQPAPAPQPAPERGQMHGVWAASTDNDPNTQNETFVRITEGETISAETWAVTAAGTKKVEEKLLSRVAPDRLAGDGLEIIAPRARTTASWSARRAGASNGPFICGRSTLSGRPMMRPHPKRSARASPATGARRPAS
jgi:hypothetical protein